MLRPAVASMSVLVSLFSTDLAAAQQAGAPENAAWVFVYALNRADARTAGAAFADPSRVNLPAYVAARAQEYGTGPEPRVLGSRPDLDVTHVRLESRLPGATIESDVSILCSPGCAVVSFQEQLR